MNTDATERHDDGLNSEPAAEIPTNGRLAGVDFGAVRIGLATCDPSQTWVTPYDTYQRRSETQDSQYFVKLAESERIMGWVVGLPIHCNGDESKKSSEARVFAQWLSRLTSLPVCMYDERFTSAEARRLLFDTGMSGQKKKQHIDRLAAYLILSHYLESSRRDAPPPSGLA